MPDQPRMAASALRHVVRDALRAYCATVLFAPAPRGRAPDVLCLPRLHRAPAFSDLDVYTSRPGAGDYGVNPLNVRQSTAWPHYGADVLIGYAGLTEPEALANAAMGSIGPLAAERAAQGRRPAPSYRAFLARELRDAKQSPLRIEHARVLDVFSCLCQRDKDALRDLDQSGPDRRTVKLLARRDGVDVATVKRRSAAGLDALAVLLYARYDVRSAA